MDPQDLQEKKGAREFQATLELKDLLESEEEEVNQDLKDLKESLVDVEIQGRRAAKAVQGPREKEEILVQRVLVACPVRLEAKEQGETKDWQDLEALQVLWESQARRDHVGTLETWAQEETLDHQDQRVTEAGLALATLDPEDHRVTRVRRVSQGPREEGVSLDQKELKGRKERRGNRVILAQQVNLDLEAQLVKQAQRGPLAHQEILA